MNKLQEQEQRELQEQARRELSRLRGDDPTLTNVSFSHLNGAKVREVADALRCNTHLEILRLLYLEVGDGVDAAIADILRVNRSLRELHIVKCRIGKGGAAAIAAALPDNNTLTHLNLMDNYIGADGAKAIAAALSERMQLKVLDLRHNKIGDDGGRALAAMLRSNTSIQRLDLEGCGITNDGAKALAAALVANDTIKTLSLMSNRIGDDGAKAIAAALVANDTIKTLSLDNNRIGDVGVKALAAALVANDTIKTLSLMSNRIGDDGAKALAAALVANDTIETLFLCNNRIGDDGVKALAAAYLLRLRPCGIYLGGNGGIGEDAWSAFDQSQRLCRKADVNASDFPAAVALIEQLLPATNFISLSAIVATKAAALRSAHPPKPERLAILDTAQRLIIDHVLAQTRLIPDAAMPLALEKIGGGGDDDKNAIDHRSDTGINALFEVCIDKPHLFKGAHMDEGMDGQGQGQGEEEETTQKTPQGNTSDKSLRVPAQDMKKRSGKRRYRQMDITNFSGKKITKV